MSSGTTDDVSVPLQLCRELVRNRGENALRALQRSLGVVSSSKGQKYVALPRLVDGLKYAGSTMSSEQLTALCAKFDTNGSGSVAVHDFLLTLREGGMSDARQQQVRSLFAKLREPSEDRVSLDTLRDCYNSLHHLTRLSRHGTVAENWDQFDLFFNYSSNPDGYLSWEEFQAFYVGVSQLYKDDDEFELLLSQTWSLPELEDGKSVTVAKLSELRKNLPPGSVSAPKHRRHDPPKRVVGYMGHIPGIGEMFGLTFDRCERASKVPPKVNILPAAPEELCVDFSELLRAKVVDGNAHSYKLE